MPHGICLSASVFWPQAVLCFNECCLSVCCFLWHLRLSNVLLNLEFSACDNLFNLERWRVFFQSYLNSVLCDNWHGLIAANLYCILVPVLQPVRCSSPWLCYYSIYKSLEAFRSVLVDYYDKSLDCWATLLQKGSQKWCFNFLLIGSFFQVFNRARKTWWYETDAMALSLNIWCANFTLFFPVMIRKCAWSFCGFHIS